MGVNQNSRKCNATATTVCNTENQLKLQTAARSAAAHIRQNRAHSDIGVSLLLLCEIVSSDVLHTPIRKLYDTSFPRSVYSLRVCFLSLFGQQQFYSAMPKRKGKKPGAKCK